MTVTGAELDAICRQAIEEYPHESCGVVVARGEERRLVRCRNVQNELHAKDPVGHPRDARTAYYIDPADVLRLCRMESAGYAIRVIYHSHVEAGAYFSETDRSRALFDGQPIYPDATYLVASVTRQPHAGAPAVDAAAAFRWDAARRDFVEIERDEFPQPHEERST